MKNLESNEWFVSLLMARVQRLRLCPGQWLISEEFTSHIFIVNFPELKVCTNDRNLLTHPPCCDTHLSCLWTSDCIAAWILFFRPGEDLMAWRANATATVISCTSEVTSGLKAWFLHKASTPWLNAVSTAWTERPDKVWCVHHFYNVNPSSTTRTFHHCDTLNASKLWIHTEHVCNLPLVLLLSWSHSARL